MSAWPQEDQEAVSVPEKVAGEEPDARVALTPLPTRPRPRRGLTRDPSCQAPVLVAHRYREAGIPLTGPAAFRLSCRLGLLWKNSQ